MPDDLLVEELDEAVPGKKKGKKGSIKIVIITLVAVVLLGGLGFGGFYVTQLMEPSIPEYKPVEVVYNYVNGMTTNLSNYEDLYLRFQYSLVFEVDEENQEVEYAEKLAFIDKNTHLIKSATISAMRSKTRRELGDPDAPIHLCDTILETINQLFYEAKPTDKEYGVRSGFGALIGKDTEDTIARRAVFERLSTPAEMQFTKCYHTDYILQ